eukprot:scaffold20004_cov23-Tisochrysis_lutea.AAC.1
MSVTFSKGPRFLNTTHTRNPLGPFVTVIKVLDFMQRLTQQQRAVWTDLEVKAHTAARTLRGLTRECTHMNALIRECTHT